jgi:hypothetical protein
MLMKAKRATIASGTVEIHVFRFPQIEIKNSQDTSGRTRFIPLAFNDYPQHCLILDPLHTGHPTELSRYDRQQAVSQPKFKIFIPTATRLDVDRIPTKTNPPTETVERLV